MSPNFVSKASRREFLSALCLAGGALCSGLECILVPARIAGGHSGGLFAGGEFLGTVAFAREGRVQLDVLQGRELDGRLYTDLRALEPESALIPIERFYVRTRASDLLDSENLRSIELRSLTGEPIRLPASDLARAAKPMGAHLMECAGNSREARFGLISVAEWSGVPLADILERLPPTPGDARILVSGFDRYASTSATSTPGASWIFSRSDIEGCRAFLATEMNDKPLARDHGAPIRLLVPGWYGCACIKWVNEIRVVAEDAECTGQMQEFAVRTHQPGTPKRVRDYQPAIIDQAAMPIRVDKWRVNGELEYRVAGIVWGGSRRVTRLEIRFNPEENYVPVSDLRQNTNDPWSFWTHTWRPAAPGTYLLRLRVAEPAVRTRRLDMGFYVRAVDITEV